MGMVAVTINLPEELASEAQRRGILSEATIVRMIEAEIEAQRQAAIDDLFAAMKRLHELEPKITPEEIDAEIAAYRAEEAEKRAALQKSV